MPRQRPGSRGTTMLVGALLLGLLLPHVAHSARVGMQVAVLVFTVGTLLRVEPGELATSARSFTTSVVMPILAVIGWPLAIACAGRALSWPATLTVALVAGFSVPPSSGNAVIARLLGLQPAMAIVMTLSAMALTPLTAPAVLQSVANLPPGTIDPISIAKHLALLLGLASILAVGLRHVAAEPMRRWSRPIDSVVFAALAIFAVGTMDGMQAIVINEPFRALSGIAIAFAINFAVGIISLILTPGPASRRCTVALLMSNRNVGLLWVAMGAATPPDIAFYFACAQFPIFVMPKIMQMLIAWYARAVTPVCPRSTSGDVQ